MQSMSGGQEIVEFGEIEKVDWKFFFHEMQNWSGDRKGPWGPRRLDNVRLGAGLG